jgi:hypothetical protein
MLANEERAATEAAAEARTEAERMEGEVESVRGRTARTERNARRVVAQMRRCLAIARIDLAVWERQLEAMRLGQAGSITRANELIEEFNADLDRANAMRRRCAR